MRLTAIMAATLLLAACEGRREPPMTRMHSIDDGSRQDAIRTGCYNGYLAACNCSEGTPSGVTCKADEDGCPTGILGDALAQRCLKGSYVGAFDTDDKAANMLALSIESCGQYLVTYRIVVLGHTESRAKMAAKLLCEHRMPIWYARKQPTPVEKSHERARAN